MIGGVFEMFITDQHVHSHFSDDSTESLDMIIQKAIQLGMRAICITDHHDVDFPVQTSDGMKFQLDIAAYEKELFEKKDKYVSQIDVRFGIELGLMTGSKQEIERVAGAYPFDYIIGSSHLVRGEDPYYPSYYEGRTEKQAYRLYFESIYENLNNIKGYQSYGHLDYVVRYGPNKNENYFFHDYKDIFEVILKKMIEDGIALEVNTAGIANGLGYAHPIPEVLTFYKQLGGELITLGSDAHNASALGYEFEATRTMLLAKGYRYYMEYTDRKPKGILL